MFIDTHTHLYVDAFDEDRDQVLQNAIDCGVEKCFLPNIDASTIDALHEMVRKHPENCYPMMGLHPGSVKEDWKKQLSIIEENLFNNKYIAVGEIGMDLYWDKTFVDAQRESFKQQIEWAKQLNLPIVIHARDAFKEIFEVLDECNTDSLTGVFHCFTGNIEDAKRILAFGGFMMGIGGVLTYKNAKIDEVIEKVDIKHLILETDSPYLTPVPHRGKRNESAYLIHVAEKLADVYGVSLSKIEEQTSKNARKLFNNVG